MKEKVVCFKNHIDELNQLTKILRKLEHEWRLSQSISFHLNLILEEVFTNIVLYGYRDKNEHQIFITFTAENNIITIKVVDDAKAFNPLEISSPMYQCKTIDEVEPGGIGLHLVKSLVDDMGYERDDEKNILTLKKHY